MPSIHLPPGGSGLTTAIDDPEVKTGAAPAGVLPATVPAGRPSIGLVLDGGGALGLAHIGVLEWMEQHRIPVDRIAGTSMGSLIGALYATGRSASEINEVAGGAGLDSVFALRQDYNQLDFRRRQDRRQIPGALSAGLKGGISLRNAVLTDTGLNDFLHTVFADDNSQSLRFDQLPIPFRCVATDLNTLQPVLFEGGPVPQAVRASISIPGVFSPVEYKDHYLVDGGIMDNLPVDVVKRDLHADVVIAVELPASTFSENDVGSVIGVFTRAFSAGTAANERRSEKAADVLLLPATQTFGTGDYGKVEQLAALGYAAAEAQKTALLRYALNEQDWQSYLAAKAARKPQPPGRLSGVEIAGGSAGAANSVRRNLEPLRGQPIESKPVIQALIPVQSDQLYEANFETTHSAAVPSAPAQGTAAAGPDTGLLVRLNPTRNAPPFLLVGLDASAMSDNVTRITLDSRLVDSGLGGYGSELRSDLRVGFLTQASTEYYRLLRPDGLFVQPRLALIRQPVYLYSDQRRISERLEQEAGGELDFGRTFNPYAQLAAEYRAQTVRWQLRTGNDSLPDLSGVSQSAAVHYIFDNRTSSQIAPSGMRFDVAAGALFHTLASENAPLARMHFDTTRTVVGSNILAFSFDADTYFRRNVAEPLRFTLGGPLHLSASSIDEYRGTDTGLLRAGYLHRLFSLPTQIGQGLYLTTGYEAGEVWSPELPAFLRQDGVLGVLAATPVGAITLGASVGDAGRRKVFFTFGRLF